MLVKNVWLLYFNYFKEWIKSKGLEILMVRVIKRKKKKLKSFVS